MDERAFDRLVTRLGVTPSRRTALVLVSGAVLGGLAVLSDVSETGARGKKGKNKGKGKKKANP